ncbi:hypothetical protein HanPI659440_Chr02g0042481 [Helianthus annuus]|nr:hypothetical protein HanPI659440_Chr02g0042481 [Helianthus annuus]
MNDICYQLSAVREYQKCIDRDNSDVVAINKALFLMYLRDLSDSIKVLDSALERVPMAALNETFVVNLCSMYELAYVNPSDIKKRLATGLLLWPRKISILRVLVFEVVLLCSFKDY